jgi:pimeloyl-ACP methyl ester carboxylesterase
VIERAGAIEVNGARLGYRTRGEGDPAIVFLHGAFCSGRDWDFQVDHFGRSNSVVTIDLRGQGSSTGEGAMCTIDVMADDVVAVMAHLDVRPAVVVGHSVACKTAIEVLLSAPDRVVGLVLIDGNCFDDATVAENQFLTSLRQTGHVRVVQGLFEQMFGDSSPPDRRTAAFARIAHVDADLVEAILLSNLRWERARMGIALGQIAVPVLAIQSTTIDRVRGRVPMPPEGTSPWLSRLGQSVPGLQSTIISDSGHFSMLDNPDAVNDAIAGFVDGVASDVRRTSEDSSL